MTDPISRLNAALENRYAIQRELGEGGMATVYLAVDLKHEREVALKVLKPELAAVVGAERFLAEIKTTAALQHPNILPLHDSGEADSFLFYVMPYVAGESLRDRLDREHQLPVEDAVQIAKSLAEALEYAHSKGVIHRDIKPANILLQAGKPVIADFGIALAVGVAGGGRLTETGLSVGTPHYMSPEQATGDQSVGVSTDIYALGCVLYEMLVGEPPYTGVTAQAILGKIIAGEFTSATQERASVPAHVDAAIKGALEKLPADRFRSSQEFARALADPGFRHGIVGAEVTGSQATRWKPLAMGLGVSTLALALVAGWLLIRPDAEVPQRVERFTLDIQTVGMPGLTPDGSAVVYLGGDGPEARLFVRRWEDLDPVPIPGTEGDRIGNGNWPAVSPSGEEVAFSLNGELKVAPIRGGLVRTLTASAGLRVRWGTDGFIYFMRADLTIHRVLATGESEPEVVTRRNTDDDGLHQYLQVLPGGEFGLFTVVANPPRIEGVRIETGERTVITTGANPHFTSTGHLVFGSPGGNLLAAPFNAETMELTGQPVTLLEGLSVGANNTPLFNLSEDGTLIYSVGQNRIAEFVWVTRSGEATPVDPTHQFILPTNHGFRISPDETRVAFNGRVDLNDDIRIKHLPDGPVERLTFSPDVDYRPVWTPDGQRLTYFSGPASDDRNVWSVSADGTGQPVLVLDDLRSLNQATWSPDGQWLVVRSTATAEMGIGQRDILAFRPGTDTAASPLIASPDFVEGAPEISPDGRWLAYTSTRTGREEVFVRPFPNTDSTLVQISGDGGISPVWAKNGRELFFVDQARGLVSAQFDPATGRVLAQETLFILSDRYEAQGSNSFYDVSADGERFLMVRSYAGEDGEASGPRLILVQNFLEVVKERMGGN